MNALRRQACLFLAVLALAGGCSEDKHPNDQRANDPRSDKEIAEENVKLLENPAARPTEAGRAARKIGQYGGPEHLPILEAVATKHRHERVRDDAADALKRLKARTGAGSK